MCQANQEDKGAGCPEESHEAVTLAKVDRRHLIISFLINTHGAKAGVSGPPGSFVASLS